MKSKGHLILDEGDWTQAWHLSRLPDYYTKQAFAGDEQELAIIVNYEKQMLDLKKRQAEFCSALSGEPRTNTRMGRGTGACHAWWHIKQHEAM